MYKPHPSQDPGLHWSPSDHLTKHFNGLACHGIATLPINSVEPCKVLALVSSSIR